MIMPFGRHRGKPIDELPEHYRVWVLENCSDLGPTLRRAIELTLGLSEPEPPSTALAVSTILDPWYRQLAREFHPDKGGSHEAMKAVNRARDLLQEMGATQ